MSRRIIHPRTHDEVEIITALVMPVTEESLKHIHNAEDELEKAGIRFDLGFSSFDEVTPGEARQDNLSPEQVQQIGVRLWELDWSLRGATIDSYVRRGNKVFTSRELESLLPKNNVGGHCL